MSLSKKPLTLKLSDYEDLSKAMAVSDARCLRSTTGIRADFSESVRAHREGRIGAVWHVEIFYAPGQRLQKDPRTRPKLKIGGKMPRCRAGFWSTTGGIPFTCF